MSKIKFIIEASDNIINEQSALVFMAIARKNFILRDEIIQLVSLEESVIDEALESLVDEMYATETDGAYVLTGVAMEVLGTAATLYKAAVNPEVKERRKRQPRGTTPEMIALTDLIKAEASKNFDVKDEIEVDRSNMAVVFEKRLPSGVRKLQVQHKGMFRVIGYKVTKELLDKLVAMGMTFRESSYGNIYIDLQTTDFDVIKKIIEVI